MGRKKGISVKNRKQIRKNLHVYSRKRSDLNRRLEKEFLDHGIATVPCRVGGIGDIISPYSVPGYESLNGDFVEYVNGIVDLVPEEYPIVLSVTGCAFTREEQETVRSTVEDDFAYALGAVEQENRRHRRIFLGMTAGLLLTSILIIVFTGWPTLPTEFLFVFFWFFAGTFVEYLLLDGRELRTRRIKAGRLACLRVVFSEEYDEREYSDDEAREIFDGLYGKTEKPEK